MITKEDVVPIEIGASIPADQAVVPENSKNKPAGEGAVEIYCTRCGQPATDGRFPHFGPSMDWWYTIAGTLDEIQWVYQTDKNYWEKAVAPFARCGCGTGDACDPMLWRLRQIPSESNDH